MSNIAADFKVHITGARVENENIHIVDEKMQGRFIHVFTAQETETGLEVKTFSQGVKNDATICYMIEQMLDVYGYDKMANLVGRLCFEREVKKRMEGISNEKDED